MRKLLIPLLVLLLLGLAFASAQQPQGPVITFNSSENATPRPAVAITTAGGTFTTLLLNATSQNLRWKAYVGNVSGTLVLQDADGSNIYDWALSDVEGEVYVSRNDSVNWSAIRCATNASIAAEQTVLNITHQRVDSINRTFNSSVHREIYVGLSQIAQSTCPAIRTYVGGTAQGESASALFQEVLLADNRNTIVYASPLENAALGYASGSRFDFQLIVPDYGTEAISNDVPYYFYAELS